jgi:Zn-dependent protease
MFPGIEVLLTRGIVLLIGLPIHEWAHAWSASELGDDTARLEGRLSLNPFAHLDLYGTLMILLTGFGWARPVNVNPYRMRTDPRTGMALSALAGPAANLLVAMVCAIPFRLGLLHLADLYMGTGGLSPARVLFGIASISVDLAVFNMIPLYPLDGEKVLAGLLPTHLGDRLMSLRQFGPYLLMAALFIFPYMGLNVIGRLVGLVGDPLMRLFFTL